MEKREDIYIKKLLQLPQQFDKACSDGRWATAKYIYDTAIRVAEFLEVSEDIKVELFGSRQEDAPVEGLFTESLVIKAYDVCINRLHKTYELESMRRYGQPPQYNYPRPVYPRRN